MLEHSIINPVKIGISTCLLGKNVRYDGGHQLDRFLTESLGRFVEYVPVCPETECGLGIPREAMRLVGKPEDPRLVTIRTGKDFTDKMVQWARRKVATLEAENLCGFVFKSKSPSSGMERVKVYNDQGMPVQKGSGIFARIFMEYFPLVPVEDDGRLHDPRLRENFIERIFVLQRWRNVLEEGMTMGKLVEFHTRHKLMLLSHSPKHYRRMGRLVAEGKKIPLKNLSDTYQTLLMEALKLRTTVKKNVNVLQHLMGYFKKHLSSDEKQELLEIIAQYHKELVPLIVPVTLVNHYVRKYRQPYLAEQTYLKPHPIELQLRNHV